MVNHKEGMGVLRYLGSSVQSPIQAGLCDGSSLYPSSHFPLSPRPNVSFYASLSYKLVI